MTRRFVWLLALAAVRLEQSSSWTVPAFDHRLRYHSQQSIQQRYVTSSETTSTTIANDQHDKASSTTSHIPYVVSRGDGSTGGGGRPMPTRRDIEHEEDTLKRPKVGAEMPHGRPAWFKVPAPSQGRFSACVFFGL